MKKRKQNNRNQDKKMAELIRMRLNTFKMDFCSRAHYSSMSLTSTTKLFHYLYILLLMDVTNPNSFVIISNTKYPTNRKINHTYL